MKLLQIALIFFILSSCTKTSRVKNNLEGEKWNIVSYKKIRYAAGDETYRGTADNIGFIMFEKDGAVSLSMHGTLTETPVGIFQTTLHSELSGKYDVYGSNEDEYDAKMNVDLGAKDYYVFYINQESKRKMIFLDRSQWQSFSGDGYTIEMTLEKE